ncbi:MAG: UDP-N-acetylmuramoyl-L-alanyl-D-glutamate--2,6-diaminopimelate ligase [Candidatus Neomarinimicrobiota bacterium]|nr:UDP-N-acetylmuramoyl-L-alanyl-D-glutamate--2,6-diaminopimelate ligase [Candidatus Neomarinimicrobiota bacterium]MEE3241669.1 UDP-N-acetylmuramoyl-L-alanyl-D-glutamate--2,6-diaminopimelate ligase [Candidatus Neomarinimicrobiota bacterium]MEE3301792.1 UDP-N-acetylmuramoyl-L-alanyl-D-glutamate--2,6-diaminopimelate ligase [Candidatus Neomarinimicrobiota bacterium]
MIEIVIEKILRNIAQPNSAILGEKVSGITSNSKEVQPNFVFVAIQGINVDGNQFIKEALNKEAVCVITDSNDIEETDRIIKVENARKALTCLAANYYGNPEKHIKTIGITGTNGKTSTTLILKDILEADGKKVIQVGTLGVIPDITNLNLSLTTPDSISLFQILHHAVKEEFDYAILEVSSHALSQNRVDSIAFDAVGFTNLSLDHLDYHKSLENYFNDKKRLFNLIKDGNNPLVLSDSRYGEDICKDYPNSKKISLENDQADYFCKTFSVNQDGITGTIVSGNCSLEINSELKGRYNLENIILASSIALELGIQPSIVEKGINNCNYISGRHENISKPGFPDIIVDYGHTPDAYVNMLSSLKEIYPNKKIKVLFGAGGNRDQSKRTEMAKAVEQFATECYVVPDNPRFEDINDINNDVVKGFSKDIYTVFDDREKGLLIALEHLDADDILVIFGKGNEEFQEINGKKLHYSDRKIIESFYAS